MGVAEAAARGALRFASGTRRPPADVDALLAALPGGRAGRAGPAWRPSATVALMRVLAAMSRRGRLRGRGGARGRRRARRRRRAHGAVPEPRPAPHRLARLLLDRGRRGRPPGRRRARHPVLRLGPVRAVRGDGGRRTSSPSTRPAAPRTRACAATSRSSSPRCWTRRVALGFDAVCTGHYARIEPGADGTRELHRARGPGQGPVLRARRAGPRAAGAGDVPARRRGHQGARCGPRPPRAGSRCPPSRTRYDICFVADGDTQGFLRARLGSQPGEIVDGAGAVLGAARRRVRVHRRAAQGAGDRPAGPRRQAPVRAVASSR